MYIHTRRQRERERDILGIGKEYHTSTENMHTNTYIYTHKC